MSNSAEISKLWYVLMRYLKLAESEKIMENWGKIFVILKFDWDGKGN